MLDRNKFLVKGQTQVFSSKKTYEIADGDSGQTLGLATQKAGLMATLLGMALGKDNMPMTIEIRKKADDALVFSVRRKGFIFKKVQVLDGQGQVMGSYKAKMFSLSGGFHVYDQEGKHVADIKGKMFKAEYKFMTPDGAKEMGSVSRTWGGAAKALFTGAGTRSGLCRQPHGEDADPRRRDRTCSRKPAAGPAAGAAVATAAAGRNDFDGRTPNPGVRPILLLRVAAT